MDVLEKLSRTDFTTEREGQENFFEAFGIKDKVNLSHSTDGIYNSTIMEFKLNIIDEEKVLSQAVNYLSKIRLAGEPVPGHILLIDLFNHRAYHYGAATFGQYINALPQGPSSLVNHIKGINLGNYREEIQYSTDAGIMRVGEILRTDDEFFKVTVDQSNVFPLAQYYYNLTSTIKKKTKGSFWTKDTAIDCELRKPDLLKDYILPYKGDGAEFDCLMDKLNPKYLQKQLGAFYTPAVYAKITAKWVMNAVDTAMKENNPDGTRKYDDFIILDRCAGTGNLEAELDPYYLKHCVIGTYELQEWYHLYARLGDQVKATIPTDIKKATISTDGLIKEADACSEEYYDYLEKTYNWSNPKLFKVVLENPPYADLHGNSKHQGSATKIQSWMVSQMTKAKCGTASNDLANQFIWSAQTMLKPQRYVVYSPAKYWTVSNLMLPDYTPENAIMANRKAFHATEAGICVIDWHKKYCKDTQIDFKVIEEDGTSTKNVVVKNAGNSAITEFESECWMKAAKCTLVNLLDGNIISTADAKCNARAQNRIVGSNRVGCMFIGGNNFAALNIRLLPYHTYDGNGWYLDSSNTLHNLPFFVTTLYESLGDPEWFHKGVHTRGAGDTTKWRTDKDFLNRCFVFSCLTAAARGRSVKINGKVECTNELCFDVGTWASTKYNQIKASITDTQLTDLKKQFDDILTLAKKASYTRTINGKQEIYAPYDKDLKYNLYQIVEEINAPLPVLDTKGNPVYDNKNKEVKFYPFPDLNSKIKDFKVALKKYYQDKIVPDLFKYNLIR